MLPEGRAAAAMPDHMGRTPAFLAAKNGNHNALVILLQTEEGRKSLLVKGPGEKYPMEVAPPNLVRLMLETEEGFMVEGIPEDIIREGGGKKCDICPGEEIF